MTKGTLTLVPKTIASLTFLVALVLVPHRYALAVQGVGSPRANRSNSHPVPATHWMPPALRAAFIHSVQSRADARFHFSERGSQATASHPGQDLETTIARGRVVLARHGGRAPIGISLVHVNGGAVDEPTRHSHGARTELRRGTVTEWYVHGPLGLEQGFTVARAQVPNDGSLTLGLRVEAAGYRSNLSQDGVLVLTDGARTVTARALFAHDATGRELPSHMTFAGGILQVHVDATSAVYPVVVDPVWSEEDQLYASDAVANQNFGHAVAISGDTALIGTPKDDEEGYLAGAAYVFTRSGTVWTEQTKLFAPDALIGESFGAAVALSGDTAVVSANMDYPHGSVHVFVRSGTTWTHQRKFIPAANTMGSDYGCALAISGDTLVVGMCRAGAGAAEAGAAYVYQRTGVTWASQGRLTEAVVVAEGYFGKSVAVSGDTIVVGAPGLFGGNARTGCAYVFTRTMGTWTQQARLTGSDSQLSDEFGIGVAVDGDTVLVGAYFNDGEGLAAGAAYVFVRESSAWTEQQRLVALDARATGLFGYRVALEGNRALITGYGDAMYGASGGAAYIFARVGDTWSQETRLVSSQQTSGDRFGLAAAFSGNSAIVASPYNTIPSTNAGTAYVFTVSGGCGDGTLDGDEACDDGNLLDGDCCSSMCAIEPSGTSCRASVSECDSAEVCDGLVAQCPSDDAVAVGTPCGASPSGDCDSRDECVGSVGATATCEVRFAASSVECRASTGVCDEAEYCTGSALECPEDVVVADCCMSVAECDDADECTEDVCTPIGSCVHTMILECGEVPDAGVEPVDASVEPADGGPMDVGLPDAALPDAGMADAGSVTPGPSGCGCWVGGSRQPGAPLVAFAFVVAVAVRRARRKAFL